MATVKAYVRSSKKNNIVNVRFRLSTPGAKLLYYVSDLQINVDLFDNKREEIKSRHCTRIKRDEFSTKK